MDYESLLSSHLKFGTTKEHIIKRRGYERVRENVVIAPWWDHSMFENNDTKIEKINDNLYDIIGKDFKFTFLELKAIGSPIILDSVLSLGVTKCRNLIFMGSVGSLDENIKIGDLVVPTYSVCGDGASRYLNSNLEDEFGKFEYPCSCLTELMLKEVINISNDKDISYYNVPNYSIDTIFAQFAHIDYIKELGCKTIEMETAALFKCTDLLKINSTALFCVSDNTVVNKSLYSGRTDSENEYRRKVRNEIIPEIIINTFKQV